MTRQYFTLDVFTDKPLGGNPLAVVLDSDGLDGERMQAIAGEFNLSETVFVSPPADNLNQASIRIFTPKKELPFAGHPTVGTAILMSMLDGLEAGQVRDIVLEEKVGLVPCQVKYGSELFHAQFSLPKLPSLKIVDLDAELLAEAIGLSPDQLGTGDHKNTVCDAGVPFPTVPLANLSAIDAVKIDEAALARCFAGLGIAPEIYVYTKQCVNSDSDYHVRLFAPAFGIAEDPATGSAAASFAAQIMAYDKPTDGDHTFIIEQGIEMGRPSRIELVMKISNGILESASIGGSAVIVSEGIMRI